MQAVILAGGLGSRISEETQLRPKPMIEIGGKPILWHIMKIYSHNGINDFIICCGYKGYMIKEYFANYALHMSDISIDISNNSIEFHRRYAEPWKITLLDTGDNTGTGGRIKKSSHHITGDTFCLTYGDGVADLDVRKVIQVHESSNNLVTLTGVKPPGRFGSLSINSDSDVTSFSEKPDGDGHWINGGFFVVDRKCLDYIDSDLSMWETGPLYSLCRQGKLGAYKHHGFGNLWIL